MRCVKKGFFDSTKEEIRMIFAHICNFMRLHFRCRTIKVSSETAFCLLLYCLSAPNRYKEKPGYFRKGEIAGNLLFFFTDVID